MSGSNLWGFRGSGLYPKALEPADVPQEYHVCIVHCTQSVTEQLAFMSCVIFFIILLLLLPRQRATPPSLGKLPL